MSISEQAETLSKHRPLLLAIEAIGWLHMTGKAHADFLRKYGGQYNDYDDLRWHEQRAGALFLWNERLQWVKESFSELPWPNGLDEFLTKHRGRDPGLLGLLQAGHGMASGIEKNVPARTSEYLGQDVTHMWLGTAFGHPARNLLTDLPPMLTKEGWPDLLGKIRALLDELEDLGKSSTDPNEWEKWWKWREGAIGRDGFLRKPFCSTLAETRLPNNDVTLWDQSYVAAALFKSAMAGAILEGGEFNWTDLKQKTRWRLLTVGIGADHYEARAVKIGDWTGSQLALERFFKEVRKLVEVELAVGSFLYADSHVHVFSFPGERLDRKGGLTNDKAREWSGWLADKIDEFCRERELETPPYCEVSEESSRSLIKMTERMSRAKKQLAVPVHRKWTISQTKAEKGHVCPVCQVRLNSRPTDKRLPDKQRPCSVCRRRRTHRLDAWREGELGSDSIWLTELADENDRIALLTMSFDLEPWLDGTRVDSLRTQAIPYWRQNNEWVNHNLEKVKEKHPYANLVSYVQGKLGNFDKTDRVLCALHDGYRHESNWPDYFAKLVEDRADAPKWENLSDDERARWVVHQVLRKNASPGRVYRFWRTTQEFFDGLLQQFCESASKHSNRWRVRRLALTCEIEEEDRKKVKDRDVLNGHWRDGPISLLYRGESEDFLTICNLARLLADSQKETELQGEELPLKKEEDHEERITRLNVTHVNKNVGWLGVYHPVIPLEKSPERFRVLVPLSAASKCVNTAIQAWNNQFSRVWDRMPLRIGIVAFPRMIPYQAVIEAARNLEAALDNGEPETWRVAENDCREGIVSLSFVREDDEHELQTVPVHLPDGRRDVFYPHCAVEDSLVQFRHDFQHPKGRVYRHMQDLRPGDGIEVHPSKYAWVFLDSTARRFEQVRPRHLSEWSQARELWRLLCQVAPSLTALRGAWSLLAEKRDSWHTPDGEWLEGGEEHWLKLVRSVMAARVGAPAAAVETIVDMAQRGILESCLGWYLTVLKSSLKEVGDEQ